MHRLDLPGRFKLALAEVLGEWEPIPAATTDTETEMSLHAEPQHAVVAANGIEETYVHEANAVGIPIASWWSNEQHTTTGAVASRANIATTAGNDTVYTHDSTLDTTTSDTMYAIDGDSTWVCLTCSFENQYVDSFCSLCYEHISVSVPRRPLLEVATVNAPAVLLEHEHATTMPSAPDLHEIHRLDDVIT